MFNEEILRTVARENLREWARINGADMEAFNKVELEWETATATGTEPETPVTVEE